MRDSSQLVAVSSIAYVTFMNERERIVKEPRPRSHTSEYFWKLIFFYESAAQLRENSESRRQNAIFLKPFSRRREDEWNGIFSN